MPSGASLAAVALCGALAASPVALAGDVAADRSVPAGDAGLVAAWQALRNADCARCHGKNYDGLAAPSIIDYVRLVSRDLFIRKILDGDPGRGMPGYRSVAPIAARIDEIHRYFIARAEGTIDVRAAPSAGSAAAILGP
jgi:mono/diheme cytochrome c family protein